MDLGKNTRFQSGEKAAENGRKGGIASGKSKRRKANMQRMAQDILDGVYKDKNGTELTGEEIVMNGLLNLLSKPSSPKFIQAVQLLATLTGSELTKEEKDKLKAETQKIKSETKLIDAKTKLMTMEDDTGLAKLDEIIAGLTEVAYAETDTEAE